MYRIDLDTNNIAKLKKRQFGDLKLREREHLQEWIAKNPEVLGEELLIIQKEFSGFNDTNERLDLLALDKDGELVIIENKLDDTGRDVVWQALKYTSYCSTLTTDQIIKIYQDYLTANSIDEDARENIQDFIESQESELYLNRNDQRIIFVANNYRKEVTSTVLWLLKHDIKVQCFRTIPYSMGNELLLQIEQIIPLPETQEYMIEMLEKDKEEKSKSKKVKESEARLIEFWTQFKQELSKRKIHHLDNVSINPRYYMGFGAGGGGRFVYCMSKTASRIELYYSQDEDKKIFDAMHQYKDQIQIPFEGTMVWQRLDNKKASRIKFEIDDKKIFTHEGGWENKDNWEAWINWFIDAMEAFYETMKPVWDKVQKKLK